MTVQTFVAIVIDGRHYNHRGDRVAHITDASCRRCGYTYGRQDVRDEDTGAVSHRQPIIPHALALAAARALGLPPCRRALRARGGHPRSRSRGRLAPLAARYTRRPRLAALPRPYRRRGTVLASLPRCRGRGAPGLASLACGAPRRLRLRRLALRLPRATPPPGRAVSSAGVRARQAEVRRRLPEHPARDDAGDLPRAALRSPRPGGERVIQGPGQVARLPRAAGIRGGTSAVFQDALDRRRRPGLELARGLRDGDARAQARPAGAALRRQGGDGPRRPGRPELGQ
jgi:hypothetical protein